MINSYLQQLQESSIPSKWRQRVEVYILKDDKLIVGYKKLRNLYQSPGGGIEKGQTLYSAAESECLEELGVQIKNPKLIIKESYKIDWYALQNQGIKLEEKIKQRMKFYRGQEIYFLKAEFDKIDKRKYETGNDKMIPIIMTKEKFIKELQKNDWPINKHRIKLVGML